MHPNFITLPAHAKDITGQRFGRLIVLGCTGNNHHAQRVWLCLCDCGAHTSIATGTLTGGHTRSCGCLLKETAVAKATKHGKSRDGIYRTWHHIVDRCTKPSTHNYKYYGERGILIYPEWQHDFNAFCEFVTQLPHYGEKGYTLDRINNDGNYEPGNVQWASRSDQQRNTRRSRLMTLNGRTQTAVEWAEELKINTSTLHKRIALGWSDEEVLTTPIDIPNGKRTIQRAK